jgi:hypothetical protein
MGTTQGLRRAMKDYLNYKGMVERALRGVLTDTLKQVAEHGLRGNHSLYISFLTTHPGVTIAEYLHDKYPREMTIILQHQFWDLDVSEEGFDVTLSFNNVPERLSIPFDALTGFTDPSVQFGLQFKLEGEGANVEAGSGTQRDGPATPIGAHSLAKVEDSEADAGGDTGEAEVKDSEKIVTLDQFRKK